MNKTDRAHEEMLEAEIARLKRTLALLQDRISLLEEENSTWADMLKERGVDVRAHSLIALELPPPLTQPLPPRAEIFAIMTPAERRLLAEVRGADPILMLLKSDSTVDTGGWFSRQQVWVCALARELALFAAGHKPFLQKTPYAHLRESIYNHSTTAVVLAPSRGLKLHTLAVPPLEGYQLLAQIYNPNKGGEST